MDIHFAPSPITKYSIFQIKFILKMDIHFTPSPTSFIFLVIGSLKLHATYLNDLKLLWRW